MTYRLAVAFTCAFASLAHAQPKPTADPKPGDKMIDWASPCLAGDAAAQSIQAVRLALRGRAGSG